MPVRLKDCSDNPKGIEFLDLRPKDEGTEMKSTGHRGLLESRFEEKPAGPHARQEQGLDPLRHLKEVPDLKQTGTMEDGLNAILSD
jgi:hypothetical protein